MVLCTSMLDMLDQSNAEFDVQGVDWAKMVLLARRLSCPRKQCQKPGVRKEMNQIGIVSKESELYPVLAPLLLL